MGLTSAAVHFFTILEHTFMHYYLSFSSKKCVDDREKSDAVIITS